MGWFIVLIGGFCTVIAVLDSYSEYVTEYYRSAKNHLQNEDASLYLAKQFSTKELETFCTRCSRYSDDSFAALMGSILLLCVYEMSKKSFAKITWVNKYRVKQNIFMAIRDLGYGDRSRYPASTNKKKLNKEDFCKAVLFIRDVNSGFLNLQDIYLQDKYIEMVHSIYIMIPYDLSSYWDVSYEEYKKSLNKKENKKEGEDE